MLMCRNVKQTKKVMHDIIALFSEKALLFTTFDNTVPQHEPQDIGVFFKIFGTSTNTNRSNGEIGGSPLHTTTANGSASSSSIMSSTQYPQECGGRRCDQFPGRSFGARTGGHAHHQSQGCRSGDREQSMIGPDGPFSQRQSTAGHTRHPQGVECHERPHGIHNGIDGSYFVKMDGVTAGGTVRFRFGVSQFGKGSNGRVFDPRRNVLAGCILQHGTYLRKVTERAFAGRGRVV